MVKLPPFSLRHDNVHPSLRPEEFRYERAPEPWVELYHRAEESEGAQETINNLSAALDLSENRENRLFLLLTLLSNLQKDASGGRDLLREALDCCRELPSLLGFPIASHYWGFHCHYMEQIATRALILRERECMLGVIDLFMELFVRDFDLPPSATVDCGMGYFFVSLRMGKSLLLKEKTFSREPARGRFLRICGRYGELPKEFPGAPFLDISWTQCLLVD